MRVRLATPDDHLTVLRIVNGAMLEIDAGAVEQAIDAGNVLVAAAENRVLGTAVLEPKGASEPTETSAHIDAIAVRRARRGQGIGRELVEFAAERFGTLTAECDPRVRPFYESLGFDIEERVAEDGRERLRGSFESED